MPFLDVQKMSHLIWYIYMCEEYKEVNSMENNSKSNSIACIKKIGHIDEFTYRNSIYCMLLSNVGGEVRLSDYEN